MTAQANQLHADLCPDFSFQEQDDSWISTEDWQGEFPLILAVESFDFHASGESPIGVAPLGPAAYSPGQLLFEHDMDWESLFESGFESTEMLVECSSTDFDIVPADADAFNYISPLSLTPSSPIFTSVESDGSPWGMSPIQEPISGPLPPPSSPSSPVSLQDDIAPHVTTSIDHWDPDTYARLVMSPVASAPSNDAPLFPCTELHTRAPRLSVRDRELATHNVRVDSQALKDKLEEGGHGDKIEALNSLLGKISEFITFREIHGRDPIRRANIPPPELLRAPSFSPFLGKFHTRGKPPTTTRTLVYVCLFCGHKLPNRTQIIQHLMAKHFRYFPHECGECDATFCRPADLIKHSGDKHSGVSVPCRCGRVFSNQRNHQRHQKRAGCLIGGLVH